MRGADRELLTARGAPGEGQVRDVGAGDEHQEHHRAHYHEQRTADVAGHRFTERGGVERPTEGR
jgi:hypothetical protein